MLSVCVCAECACMHAMRERENVCVWQFLLCVGGLRERNRILAVSSHSLASYSTQRQTSMTGENSGKHMYTVELG